LIYLNGFAGVRVNFSSKSPPQSAGKQVPRLLVRVRDFRSFDHGEHQRAAAKRKRHQETSGA
jgi:hypothetical protein